MSISFHPFAYFDRITSDLYEGFRRIDREHIVLVRTDDDDDDDDDYVPASETNGGEVTDIEILVVYDDTDFDPEK